MADRLKIGLIGDNVTQHSNIKTLFESWRSSGWIVDAEDNGWIPGNIEIMMCRKNGMILEVHFFVGDFFDNHFSKPEVYGMQGLIMEPVWPYPSPGQSLLAAFSNSWYDYTYNWLKNIAPKHSRPHPGMAFSAGASFPGAVMNEAQFNELMQACQINRELPAILHIQSISDDDSECRITGLVTSGCLQSGKRYDLVESMSEAPLIKKIVVNGEYVSEAMKGDTVECILRGVDRPSLAPGRHIATPFSFVPETVLDISLTAGSVNYQDIIPGTEGTLSLEGRQVPCIVDKCMSSNNDRIDAIKVTLSEPVMVRENAMCIFRQSQGPRILSKVQALCSKKARWIQRLGLKHIEEGYFTQGSSRQDPLSSPHERPAFKVSVKSFFMGEFPVTQHLWKRIMGSNPSVCRGDLLPVENISWNDTQVFLERLNSITGLSFRLPSESEWEYASKGSLSAPTSERFKEEQPVHDSLMTRDLCAVNENGMIGMVGNVWEWCQDVYDWSIYTCPERYKKNASGNTVNDEDPELSGDRILKGGSCLSPREDTRSSSRAYAPPHIPSRFTGFRLVLDGIPKYAGVDVVSDISDITFGDEYGVIIMEPERWKHRKS